jgi:hypothetical protein
VRGEAYTRSSVCAEQPVSHNPKFSKQLFFNFKARNAKNVIIGKFKTDDAQVQLMDCDAIEDSAITHINNIKKDRINATWIAPTDKNLFKDGGVKFFYTVVEEKLRFWKPQVSSILEFSADQGSGAQSTTTSTVFVVTMLFLSMLVVF